MPHQKGPNGLLQALITIGKDMNSPLEQVVGEPEGQDEPQHWPQAIAFLLKLWNFY
jgi:hypothetical protein